MNLDDSSSHRLEGLHGNMRECRLCIKAGYDVHPKAIFSGELGAQIMIIGQAPGITEVEAGRPFNGADSA